MADIELVINIPEEVKNRLCFGVTYPKDIQVMCEALNNGISLPKGHGKLIDVNYLLNLLKCEKYESCTWKNCSDCNQEKCIRKHDILEAPTVIETNKEK